MTAKRFTVFGEWHKNNIIDEIRDNGDTLTIGEIVELLNELHDENDQLKKELNAFKPVMFKDMRKGTVILYRKGDDQ